VIVPEAMLGRFMVCPSVTNCWIRGSGVPVAANLLDIVIKNHVVPVLKDAGFVKSGKTFRRTASNGDVAVIDFQRSAGSWRDRIIFFVNLAAVPVTQHDWLCRDSPVIRARKPSSAAGLWRERVLARMR
jgi:hypothetical protein